MTIRRSVAALSAAQFASATSEERQRSTIEASPGLEHANDATNRPCGTGLAAVCKVPVEERFLKSRRHLPNRLQSIADGRLDMKAAVGRAVLLRDRGFARRTSMRFRRLIGPVSGHQAAFNADFPKS